MNKRNFIKSTVITTIGSAILPTSILKSATPTEIIEPKTFDTLFYELDKVTEQLASNIYKSKRDAKIKIGKAYSRVLSEYKKLGIIDDYFSDSRCALYFNDRFQTYDLEIWVHWEGCTGWLLRYKPHYTTLSPC